VGVVEREFADVYKRIEDLQRQILQDAKRNAELANRIATMELLGCKRCRGGAP
jgi:hypothetical protein